MNIRELYQKKRPVISFEIFPPKKNYPLSQLLTTIETLVGLNPDFISVTYGAGGSTRDRTIEIASIIKENFQVEPLAHLTCISSTKDQIEYITRELDSHQIHNILALRGDKPSDPNFKFPTPLHYEYASDLIKELNSRGNYSIGAAFYPEGHVEAPNKTVDFRNVAFKVEQGVDFLISQMFFANKYLIDSISSLRDLGVSIPISAGIMPLTNYKQISRIADLCGCTIPHDLSVLLQKNIDSPESMYTLGIQFAVDQIRDLIAKGIEGIHIYTMNKPEIASSIIHHIQDLL